MHRQDQSAIDGIREQAADQQRSNHGDQAEEPVGGSWAERPRLYCPAEDHRADAETGESVAPGKIEIGQSQRVDRREKHSRASKSEFEPDEIGVLDEVAAYPNAGPENCTSCAIAVR